MKPLLKNWNDISLTTKFSIVFNVLLSLIILVVVSSYVSFLYINKAEENIRKSTQIERIVLQMDLGQQKAKQLLGSFFLHCRLSTLQEAHERYAQPSVLEIAEVISLSRKLKNLLSDAKGASIAGINETDFNLYLASAKRFADTSSEAIELVSKKGAPKHGIRDQLLHRTQLVASKLQASPTLKIKFSDIIITYQNYLIAKQRPIMQTAQNMLDEFRNTIKK